jgi:thiol:disulfide interchange protein DsbC
MRSPVGAVLEFLGFPMPVSAGQQPPMKAITASVAAFSLMALLPLTAHAEEATEALRAQLMKTYPDAKSGDISASPIPGLYEMRLGPEIVYVSADGQYLLKGDLISVKDDRNLTEARRSAARLAAINSVGEDRMIIFQPKQVKHTITVFTDVDCGYCRKLHRQINDYLAQGIRVRYMFFPRSGPNTESWYKAEKVWCSADRNSALTRAKLGEALQVAQCTPNPVQQHYSLGLKFGIVGTPAIILDNGELVPGYASPTELSTYLDRKS